MRRASSTRSGNHLLVLNGNFEVVSASRAFYKTFGVTPEETQGQLLYDTG